MSHEMKAITNFIFCWIHKVNVPSKMIESQKSRWILGWWNCHDFNVRCKSQRHKSSFLSSNRHRIFKFCNFFGDFSFINNLDGSYVWMMYILWISDEEMDRGSNNNVTSNWNNLWAKLCVLSVYLRWPLILQVSIDVRIWWRSRKTKHANSLGNINSNREREREWIRRMNKKFSLNLIII